MQRTRQLLMVLMLAAVGWGPPAEAGLSFAQVCALKAPLWIQSADTELLTGPEVLNHLPGPTPENFGDERIGTADDGIHPGLKPSAARTISRARARSPPSHVAFRAAPAPSSCTARPRRRVRSRSFTRRMRTS
jgi:hypothetical protein